MLIEFPILSLIVFLPLLGAVLTFLLGTSDRVAKGIAMGFSLAVLALASLVLVGFLWPELIELPVLTVGPVTYRAVERAPWVPQVGVSYILGVDELSVLLVFLNALLTPLALVFSWDEHHRVPEFFAMFLFMETTVNGVFLSLDMFQFLVFWEVGLVPIYFIISVWGGPRKRYAAMKFFMYTFLASLPLLVSVFAFYFYAGTFDMIQIIATTPMPIGLIGNLMFLAMLVAFGTKLPTWPLHTWLPDAHVEAPTGGSVLLAGILLKLGGYGLVRFNVQMLPDAAQEMFWALAAVGVISIVYGAIVCIAQDDLKRLVAFSSVSHMGFVTLGIAAGVHGYSGSGSAPGAGLAFAGAIFQMFAHGLISAALFMVAGALGHKIGTRNISDLGGIAKRAPWMATFIMISFLASLGLPGLVGFVAEFSVFVGVYAAFGWWVFVPILSVVFTAAYYIWAMQRAIFGPLNPRWESMPDLKRFEAAPLAVLVAAIAVFGIFPVLVLELLNRWTGIVLGGM